MPLSLVCPLTYISQVNSILFTAQGGVAPYVYSVEPGGAGGSINASTGSYTSPITTGVDTIKVVDANLDEATLDITVGTALELFCDIIKTEMDLDDDQIYLWDQKVNIPKDFRLYVIVGILSKKPFGNNNRFQSAGTSLQSINMQATLSVEMLSRSFQAADRGEELVMSFMSDYAQSQQEINSFYVAPLTSSWVNLSDIDGAAIPYRFNLSVNIQYFVKKTKAVPYYNNFEDVEVTTEP